MFSLRIILTYQIRANKYGQEEGLTIHSLRHTYITHLLLQTRDIAGTMTLSGHRSLQALSKYLHLLDSGFTNAALVLEGVDGKLTASQ